MIIRPCVGCGYCCTKAMCAVGVTALGRMEKRCPFLLWSEKYRRYFCWMALRDKEFATWVYIGKGCSSALNTWRRDVRKRG